MSQPNPTPPAKIGEFNDDSLRQIAREIVIRRTLLKTHLIVYILVNALLAFINIYIIAANSGIGAYFDAFTNPNRAEILWHLWSLVCWGLAVVIHSFAYIMYRKGLITTSSGGLMIYHAFIYIAVSALLAFINWFPTFQINWVFWPIGFWGFGVFLHYLFYYSHKPKNKEDSHKTWMDRQIDEELKRVKKN